MPAPRQALALFLALGMNSATIPLAIAAAPDALAQGHQNHPGGGHLGEGGEGGEGREGGEGGEAGHAAVVRSDVDLLVVLAQMQGHLLVAQDLLNQGQVAAAEPHVGHPVDELYGAVEPVLEQRRISPFLSSLEALRQQVRISPTSPSTTLKLRNAQQAIAQAGVTGVSAAVRANPQTVAAVVRQLAASAAAEYEAAVAEDHIVELIEYQDGRGFLLEARRLLQGAISSQPASQPGAAAQLSDLQTSIEAMLRAFPSVMPPTRTLLSPQQLDQLQQGL